MSNPYTEGYFERGEGSNYYNYGPDVGWGATAQVLQELLENGELPYPAEDGQEPQLLEMGSAKGYFLREADLWGFNARGVDISEYAVRQTPLNHNNRVHDVAKEELPFSDESFHVVCSWEFLEHIHGPDIEFVLDESLRVLAPGGVYIHRIAITDGSMGPDHDATHVSMFPRIFWEEEFVRRGLTHLPKYEKEFSREFKGRDWEERFFCWYKPAI